MPKNVLTNAETRMSKAIDSLKREFAVLRTGRASAALLENIQVDYYGMPTPINQMAQVTVPEARQLVIKPYDKSTLSSIERAINEANIGLTPNNDGEVIRLNVPALTEERRRDLAKQCKNETETAKVSVRNARRDAIDVLKKQIKEGLPEDAEKDAENEVQKLHDKFIKQIDEIYAKKEKEIMTV